MDVTRDVSETSGVDLDWIMSELDAVTNSLPEEAIRAAQQNRELVIPRLIDVVGKATVQALEGDLPEGSAPFFALFLLTEFEVKEALPLILKAVTLPDDLTYTIFGDIVPETLSRILAVLAGDQRAVIDELILDSNVDESVRWAAADAYKYLVRDGNLNRDSVVSHFKAMLRQELDSGTETVCLGLLSVLYDFSGDESREEVEEAFQRGLVDESMFSLDDFEMRYADSDPWENVAFTPLNPTKIEDTCEELRDWAWFQDDHGGYSDSELKDLRVSDVLDDDLDEDWDDDPFADEPLDPPSTIRNTAPRVGRNDPCPCGSGKKHKKCCGKS